MKSPFKFLNAYEKEDSEIFFGRDEETKKLYELVLQSRLTLLYGASGTGKTSLIRCGLGNQFQSHDWKEIYIRRKKNLNDSLWAGLQKNALSLDFNENVELHEAIESLFLDYFTPIYLIFDQFEELFILGTVEEQIEFMQSIADLLQNSPNCYLIFSMREEYLGYLYEFEKQIPDLLQSRLRVEPMSRANLMQVVEGTTEKHGIQIENPAQNTEQILLNISGKQTGSVSLPYLQVYLDKLYRKAYQENKSVIFSEKLVQETGAIQDVLDDFLGEQIREADQKFQEKDLCRKILNEFLSVEGTKRPRELPNLQKSLQKWVDTEKLQNVLVHLMSVQILRADDERYELAHDSLANAIDRRRTAEEKAIIELQKMLHENWIAYQKTGSLISAENLSYIQSNPYFNKIELSENDKKLIQKSEAEIKRQKRNRNLFISGLAVLTVCAIGFGVYALNQRNEADKAKEQAVKAKDDAILQREQAEKNLELFKKEQADKAKIKFQNLENRAKVILDAGGCPKEILVNLQELTQEHPDSIALTDRIQVLQDLNPNCK